MSVEELASNQAHLWYAWTARSCSSERLAWYRSLLGDDELARMERFRFEHLKQEYLLTHALCRLTLSRYADVPPNAWRFATNAFGRPHIAEPETLRSLRFNLSNIPSLVACLVVRDVEAGVDVEDAQRDAEVLDLADSHFSESESAALRALPPSHQRRRFFELWTLKESYIKARGMGLSIPLQQFSFELDKAPPIEIAFGPSMADAAGAWQFHLFEPDDRHLLAVSLRRGDGPAFRIGARETIPGDDAA